MSWSYSFRGPRDAALKDMEGRKLMATVEPEATVERQAFEMVRQCLSETWDEAAHVDIYMYGSQSTNVDTGKQTNQLSINVRPQR